MSTTDNSYYGKTFTTTLTNNSITISGSDGYRSLSITCTSTTAGTVLGTGKIGGNASASISIAQNSSVSFTSNEGTWLDQITITAPASCTLLIVAQS